MSEQILYEIARDSVADHPTDLTLHACTRYLTVYMLTLLVIRET